MNHQTYPVQEGSDHLGLAHKAYPQNATYMAINNNSWVERLFMNLLSYSIVLIPIAFLVITARHKLLPKFLLDNPLIQLFVHGSSKNSRQKVLINDDSTVPLVDDNKQSIGSSERPLTEVTNSSWSTLEFAFCLIGLQVSYLIWGLLQEKIMTTEYPITSHQHLDLSNQISINLKYEQANPTQKHRNQTSVTFDDSQFLVFLNRLVAFITAILAFVYTRHRQSQAYSKRYTDLAQVQSSKLANSADIQKPSAPLYKYIYSSMTNILSSWCQYEALKYVNFPTQCLSKSCKVIPVMLMSKILLNKRYPYLDYICALLLALGMFIFMFNQPINHINKIHHKYASSDNPQPLSSSKNETTSKSPALSGLTILVLYLTFDSFTSNWQQSLYSAYDISNWQMMAASNFYSILLTLTSLHQLGNLKPAFEILFSCRDLMQDCLLMSLMSSIGQMFVYHTIKRFGSVIFAVIMTLRQFLSIFLSYSVYKHHISIGSTVGLILVFLVVSFQVWHKSSKRSKIIVGKKSATISMSHLSNRQTFSDSTNKGNIDRINFGSSKQ